MRNKKGQFIHNKFTNWRIWAISSTLLFCLTAANYGNQDKVYVADKPQVEAFLVPVVVETPETVEQKFQRYFPKSHRTMLAIAKAESNLQEDAINWNCYYNKDRSVVYETRVKGSHGAACKKEHRKYSFGVDCFVLQAHYPGRKSCPKDVTLDQHLEEMAELTKKRSFQPWVTFNRGLHLAYMD